MNNGCSIAWDGTNTINVPNQECFDLTYTTPGNNDNGYFVQCASPSLGNNCFRELLVDGNIVNAKSGSCNEGVGTNTLVFFNLTGPKPGSGIVFEKENIIVQAFNATASYNCLPALTTGQVYAHEVSSICGGGVAKWTAYECSNDYSAPGEWLDWTSICASETNNQRNRTKINAHECIQDAVPRSECNTKYATVAYSNKTFPNVNFQCKMRSGDGNNW